MVSPGIHHGSVVRIWYVSEQLVLQNKRGTTTLDEQLPSLNGVAYYQILCQVAICRFLGDIPVPLSIVSICCSIPAFHSAYSAMRSALK